MYIPPWFHKPGQHNVVPRLMYGAWERG